MKSVDLYVKGVVIGAGRGYGAWASLLQYGDKQKIFSSNLPHTNSTVMDMELEGITFSLGKINQPCLVTIKSNFDALKYSIMDIDLFLRTSNYPANEKSNKIINDMLKLGDIDKHRLCFCRISSRELSIDLRRLSQLKAIAHNIAIGNAFEHKKQDINPLPSCDEGETMDLFSAFI